MENKNSITEVGIAHNKTVAFIREISQDVIGLKVVQKAHGILLHLQLALTSFIEECRIIDEELLLSHFVFR